MPGEKESNEKIILIDRDWAKVVDFGCFGIAVRQKSAVIGFVTWIPLFWKRAGDFHHSVSMAEFLDEKGLHLETRKRE